MTPSTLPSAQLLPFPRSGALPPAVATVVVPCYNEAARLNVGAYLDFLSASRAVDLVFVDDGSTDATLEVLSQIHAAYPGRVEVLSLERNCGKAEAVRRGLQYAAQGKVGFVGYWDADLATPLEAIEDFLSVGRRFAEVEVIFGARRMMLGHRVTRSLTRRTVSRLCAALARGAVRLPVGDTQCGAKLLRNTPALIEALREPFHAGWLFDVELFTRIARTLRRPRTGFYELPLAEWTEVAGSKIDGRAILRSGLTMLRLIAEIRLGLPRDTARTPSARLVVRPVPPAGMGTV